MFPESLTLILVALQRVSAFEQQRWVKQIVETGMTGSSELFQYFLGTLMPIGVFSWYGFLIMYGFDNGVMEAAVLWLAAFAFMAIYGLLSGIILRGDNMVFLFTGTILLLPVSVFLILQTSIFGLI